MFRFVEVIGVTFVVGNVVFVLIFEGDKVFVDVVVFDEDDVFIVGVIVAGAVVLVLIDGEDIGVTFVVGNAVLVVFVVVVDGDILVVVAVDGDVLVVVVDRDALVFVDSFGLIGLILDTLVILLLDLLVGVVVDVLVGGVVVDALVGVVVDVLVDVFVGVVVDVFVGVVDVLVDVLVLVETGVGATWAETTVGGTLLTGTDEVFVCEILGRALATVKLLFIFITVLPALFVPVWEVVFTTGCAVVVFELGAAVVFWDGVAGGRALVTVRLFICPCWPTVGCPPVK